LVFITHIFHINLTVGVLKAISTLKDAFDFYKEEYQEWGDANMEMRADTIQIHNNLKMDVKHIKKTHEEEIKYIKEAHDEEIKNIKEAHEKEIKHINDTHRIGLPNPTFLTLL
jgi:gas vesicle protein